MKGILYTDLKRSIFSYGFIASIFLLLGILLEPLFSSILFGESLTSLSNAEVFGISLSFGMFTIAAPVLCCLPATANYSYDVNSGFINFLVIRCGYRRYIFTRICSTLLSGALVMGIGLGIFALILSFIFTPLNPLDPNHTVALQDTIWQDLFATTGGWAYILVQILLSMLFGAVWSLAGLMLSSFYPNRFIAWIGPFAVYYAFLLFAPRLNLDILEPSRKLIPQGNSPYTFLYSIFYQLSLIILFATIFLIKTGRKKK